MVFTSQAFVFYFLPAVLLGYYALPSGLRSRFLLVASYFFYGWWNPAFVLLMLASTVVDYRCGAIIARHEDGDPRRRRALIASIVVNLSLLGFFKYWDFFASSVNGLLGWAGLGAAGAGMAGSGAEVLPLLDVILPVGISFYTFQSMSYSIDLYRRQAPPARGFFDFAAYVALFPQLIAGPIIRYRDIAEQLRERGHSLEKAARGLSYFALGFAKKVLLANNVGLLADDLFATPTPPWHLAWLGAIAYAFQIYFDFSGYSDMAIGLGLMLGFRFPENFRSPYRAESITDFWRRWHISLSTWLRDYLYIPLGGNRHGPRRTYINLGLTMLLGGLWHGAQWQFVVWGAYHGALLAAERALGKRGFVSFLARPLRIAATFVLVLIGWVFFRAENLDHAITYLGCMFGLVTPTAGASAWWGTVGGEFGLPLLAICAVVAWTSRRTEEWVAWAWAGEASVRRRVLARAGLVALFAVSLVEMSAQSHNPFLYFQF